MVKLAEVSRQYPIAAGCDALYRVEDAVLGVVGFIALHELRDGRAFGGIRRLPYATARDAVLDVVRLAEQMTMKTAFAGLPVGGGKAAIIDRPGLDLAAAYRALGEAVEQLGGAYCCGPDVGTGADELAFVREATAHVNHPDNQPASSTALGVLMGLDAVLAFTGANAAAFSAMVQGVGSVGGAVADGLVERGGVLAVADIDEARVASVVARHPGTRAVAVDAVLAEVADLLVPCALGPVIRTGGVDALRCKIICGAANNQLEEPVLAHVLSQRNILYVPDFTINAGAVIEGAMFHLHGDEPDVRARIDAAIRATGDRVASILAEARETDVTPLEAAFGRLAGD